MIKCSSESNLWEKLKSKWEKKAFKNLVLNVICCLYKSGSMISGRKPPLTLTAMGKNHLFSFFLMSDALFNQKLWSEPVLHYLYSRTLQALSNCFLLHVFTNDSLFCFRVFLAAVQLLKWNCPGRLSSASISWCTRPFQSWEPHAGAPGTSGYLHCW